MIPFLERMLVGSVAPPTPLSIRRARPGEAATLVVKHGGRLPLNLVFEGRVTIGDVRRYCIGQCGWDIEHLGVSVDGRHYDVRKSHGIKLDVPPKRIEFGAPAPAVYLEFRRETGAKG